MQKSIILSRGRVDLITEEKRLFFCFQGAELFFPKIKGVEGPFKLTVSTDLKSPGKTIKFKKITWAWKGCRDRSISFYDSDFKIYAYVYSAAQDFLNQFFSEGGILKLRVNLTAI